MADPILNHPLRHRESVILVVLFTVFVLYIFGPISQRWSNFLLRSQRAVLRLAYAQSNNEVPEDVEEMLAGIPTDIRTVAKHFHLNPILVLLATCPSCSATYAPYRTRDGFDAWPSTCTYRKFGEDQLNDDKNLLEGLGVDLGYMLGV
jgi:hypothetical protein